ncbi:MAG: YceI family protein [Candidatus Krumholzibacteriia bacterium]
MAGPIRIDPKELSRRLGAPDAPVLVDVLPAAAHAAYRLPGAVNACVFEMVFLERVAGLVAGPDASLVIIGAGGDSLDADLAADKLLRAGYTRVAVLAGGRTAWHAAGLPAEGDASAPAAPDAPVAGLAGRWSVDIDRSWLRWTGRNPNGFHDGGVALNGGVVSVDAERAQGRIEVDPASLVNFDLAGEGSQPVLVAHLLSDDFLFVGRHPEVAYELASVSPLPDAALTTATHRIEGSLTMRGITAPLGFDATVSALADGSLAAEAHFDLDRTRWGMIYGSARFFAHLGMHLVFDGISISLRLVLAPA